VAGTGLATCFWFHGGTVSHRLVGVGTGAVTPFNLNMALVVSRGVGVGLGAGASLPLGLVLGTGPNSRVGSESGSTRNRTVATGLTTRKTRPTGNGPVLPPKTRHFNITTLPPIKYLSSDCIMT
jgi:hypothetical protein